MRMIREKILYKRSARASPKREEMPVSHPFVCLYIAVLEKLTSMLFFTSDGSANLPHL